MGLFTGMKAVRPAERKHSEAGPVFAMRNLGRPVWTPADYERLAEAGYNRNVIAYKSVNLVAQAAASVNWKLFDGLRERAEVEEHDLLTLLAHPNPLQGRSEFIENVIAYYLIAGNSYIEAVPEENEPNELWTPRPDRMRVVAGEFGLPKGFVYSVGGKSKTWDADPATGQGPILHLKTFHPTEDWYGLSPLQAAARGVDLRNSYDTHNLALVQNDARPSGALVYKPDREAASDWLDDEQFEKLKAELDDSYRGPLNTGRPLLLQGGLEWQQMGFSPKDQDYINGKHASSRDIALAFGVPPQLLGIPGDNTYSNYQEARLALWEETVIPLLRMLRDELNNWLAPKFGEGLVLEPDMDDVPALALRRQARMDALDKTSFLSLNEKRKGSGHDEVERGDIIAGDNFVIVDGEILVPAGFIPLGAEPENEDEEEARGRAALPSGGLDDAEAKARHRLAYGDGNSE